MKIQDIKAMRDRAPFRPFLIHLSSGASVPVNHPEQLNFSPDVADLFILWEGPQWHLIDIAAVERLTTKTKSTK